MPSVFILAAQTLLLLKLLTALSLQLSAEKVFIRNELRKNSNSLFSSRQNGYISEIIRGSNGGVNSVITSDDEIYIGNIIFRREGYVRKTADDESREVLLVLPSIDGLHLECEKQFDPVSELYDGWWLYLRGDDRSSVPEIIDSIASFLKQLNISKKRKCVVSGNSFGGLLALALALEYPELIKALVLINPATSINRSSWPVLGNALSLLPNNYIYKFFASALLVSSLPDISVTSTVVGDILKYPLYEQWAVSLKYFSKFGNMMGSALDQITPETLRFRLNGLIIAGAELVNQRLDELEMPVLIVAGSDDRVVPSSEEAKRLSLALQNCYVKTKIIPRVGHAVLLNPDIFNLASTTKDFTRNISNISEGVQKVSEKEKMDRITDFRLNRNTATFRNGTAEALQSENLNSPIFFSIGSNGDMHLNLRGVPDIANKPILFIGNHQFFALDMAVLIARVLEEKGYLIRGLAHPFVVDDSMIASKRTRALANMRAKRATEPLAIFESSSSNRGLFETSWRNIQKAIDVTGDLLLDAWSIQSSRDRVREEINRLQRRRAGNFTEEEPSSSLDRGVLFRALGAVAATPRNYYRLLSTNQPTLLYPGGAREALHGKGEEYQLFWPENPEFVRAAAKFNAIVVPLSAIGCADTAGIVAETKDLENLPFGIGRRLKDFAQFLPTVQNPALPQVDSMPIPLPKLPARYYFLFGQPIELSELRSKEEEREMYELIKSRLEGGIEYLKQGMARDPYSDPIKRILKERETGKQAPTFSPLEIPWKHLTSTKQ